MSFPFLFALYISLGRESLVNPFIGAYDPGRIFHFRDPFPMNLIAQLLWSCRKSDSRLSLFAEGVGVQVAPSAISISVGFKSVIAKSYRLFLALGLIFLTSSAHANFEFQTELLPESDGILAPAAMPSKKDQALALIQSGYVPAISVEKIETDFIGGCRVETYRVSGRDPVDRALRMIRVRSFQGTSAKRAVIIMPSIVGTSVLETGYAQALCDRNIRAAIIESIERDNPINLDIASYDRAALRKLAAIRHVVEFLAQRSNRIGILGTSAGGLSASLALGIEAKIKVGVLIATGGDLAEIAADSTEESQARLREARMKRFGFTSRVQYLDALKSGITLNNLDFAGFTGQKPAWMSVVTGDTVVPTRTQLELKRVLRPRESVEYAGDHIGGILKTYMLARPSIIEFFENQL